MMINAIDKFSFYEGYKTIEDAERNIERLGLLKYKCYFVKFLGQYYPVFYHSSSRVVVIGKENVYYTQNGRLREVPIEKAFIDFEITKRDKNSITTTLAEELKEIDQNLELFYYPNKSSKEVKKVKEDMTLSKYVVILGVTFASEFYTFGNLRDMSKYFKLTPQLISFLKRTRGAVSINPFTQELEFEDGSIGTYKINFHSTRNYQTVPSFALLENNKFADDGKRHWLSIARYREMYPNDNIMYEQPDFREDKTTCKWCGSKLPTNKSSYCTDECKDAFYRATKVDSRARLPYKIQCRDNFICQECNKDLAYINEYGMKIPISKLKDTMDSVLVLNKV